jgi:hypothetical protein
MRTDHKHIFSTVAQKLRCWIGLREPNALAERWFYSLGFIPKPQICKAKTANNPDSPYGGLVVNPYKLPEAFRDSNSLAKAQQIWDKFTFGGLSYGFTCNDAGILLLNKCGIYSDYDLMYISEADKYGKHQFSVSNVYDGLARNIRPVERNQRRTDYELFHLVQWEINLALGIPMIQHGAEFNYGDMGAAANEHIFYFGPSGEFEVGYSSMSTKFPH